MPEELLELPNPPDAPPPKIPGLPDELVAEVLFKRRELRALRKRWWHERQDPNCTVRRTLAVADLPETFDSPDKPPDFQNTSLFDRIVASMTYGVSEVGM